MASLKGIKDVDPSSFMPHEDQLKEAELSLEEYMAQTYGE